MGTAIEELLLNNYSIAVLSDQCEYSMTELYVTALDTEPGNEHSITSCGR